MSRDKSALSYEFMATFKHSIWYTITNACVTDDHMHLFRAREELAIIPVYNVAKRKNTTGRIVCVVKGNSSREQEKGRSGKQAIENILPNGRAKPVSYLLASM
jgi:nitrate reductase NapAB chaperone NapD